MAGDLIISGVKLVSPNGLVEKSITIDNSGIVPYELPSGAIQAFAMTTAPSGWLKANGQAVSRILYANLFNAISTTFGVGDGSTTFNLPDLRGEFIRGYDDSRGVDSGRSFGSSQLDQFQGHKHSIILGTNDMTAIVSSYGDAASNWDATSTAAVQGAISAGANGTPRTGSETRPRNIAMLYCIKV